MSRDVLSIILDTILVCHQIEEQVPIQVCKTVDVLRTPIVVSKGRSVLASKRLGALNETNLSLPAPGQQV